MDTNTLPDPSSLSFPFFMSQGVISEERQLAFPDTSAAEAATREDELFYTAMRDDSNLAMDWLWLATQVTTDDRRRYCLRRALRIDPANWETKRELAQLSRGSQRRTSIFRR